MRLSQGSSVADVEVVMQSDEDEDAAMEDEDVESP